MHGGGGGGEGGRRGAERGDEGGGEREGEEVSVRGVAVSLPTGILVFCWSLLRVGDEEYTSDL